jgi:hypothetical protein
MKQLEENYSHTALIDWGADEFSLLHHKPQNYGWKTVKCLDGNKSKQFVSNV